MQLWVPPASNDPSIEVFVNEAVTDVLPEILMVQVGDESVQAPVQPVNELPGSAIAVNVTDVPERSEVMQALPQEIPAGLEVTVPDPDPVLVIVSV